MGKVSRTVRNRGPFSNTLMSKTLKCIYLVFAVFISAVTRRGRQQQSCGLKLRWAMLTFASTTLPLRSASRTFSTTQIPIGTIGTFIHRVPQSSSGGTSNFVVQGGGILLNNSIFAAAGIVTDPPIGSEPVFSNTRGTLSAAKNSLGATSQWFFNIDNNSFLDSQQFTVFGRVLGAGMTTVDAINALPTINAAVAQNAPGEDFDEVPVRDLAKVQLQNDITSNEAVMVNISVLNLPAGDYQLRRIGERRRSQRVE